jgi:hypothetical protein
VKHTRDFSFAAKLAGVAGMAVFGVLLLGSQPGSATPGPVGPTDLQPPIVTPLPPLPPKPKPCEVIKCVPPTLEPCFALPGHPCTPPTLNPCVVKPADCQPPTTTKPPTLTPRPPKSTTPTPPTTQTTPTIPTDPPTGSIPTPNRIDTGGGPSEGAPTWLFWVVPGLGVLTLAAGASGWWMARSEQREH